MMWGRQVRLWDVTGEVEVGREAVGDRLALDGVVLIRGAQVSEVRGLLAGWAVAAGHPHQCEPGLTIVSARAGGAARAGHRGFTREALGLHTDRSLVARPPSLLAAVMVTPALRGGEACLLDGAGLLAGLERRCGYDEVAGLRLETGDGTATWPVVQRGDGLVRLRLRMDELARPVSRAGDAVLAALTDCLFDARVLGLNDGDGYLIHNHRYLHGRLPFTGPRRLARLLANVAAGHRLAWLNRGFRDTAA